MGKILPFPRKPDSDAEDKARAEIEANMANWALIAVVTAAFNGPQAAIILLAQKALAIRQKHGLDSHIDPKTGEPFQ